MRTLQRITIISPGEMGAALGRKLIAGGFDVRSFVRDRGKETQNNAKTSGFDLTETFDHAARDCDLFVSVVPPGRAIDVASSFAQSIDGTSQEPPLYLDCNSVSPATAEAIGDLVGSAGARCADGVFFGTANMLDNRTVLLVSGPAAETIAEAFRGTLDVRLHGDSIGTASALKMCFGAFNKSLVALYLSVVSSAAHLHAAADLVRYLSAFYPETCRTVHRLLPSYPRHGRRRLQEIRELRSWLESIDHHTGFAIATEDVFRMLEEVPFKDSEDDYEAVTKAFVKHALAPVKG